MSHVVTLPIPKGGSVTDTELKFFADSCSHEVEDDFAGQALCGLMFDVGCCLEVQQRGIRNLLRGLPDISSGNQEEVQNGNR